MKAEKIKNILKNEYFILAVITFLALFVRLININKPFGLWYDEMLTYNFSAESFPFGILKALFRYDFHMPLYYLYVGFWMKLFGSGDTVLRLSSVMWGVLSIPAIFYLGKTYSSKKLGWLLSILCCLSPVMIYYSQELRFYSMLMFFSILSVIFFLKLIKAANKKKFFLFAASNLVILYIYTMGIIFVGIEFLLLFIHFYFYNTELHSKHNLFDVVGLENPTYFPNQIQSLNATPYRKEDFKMLIKCSIIFFILSIPYFILLFSYINASNHSMLEAFAWSHTNINSLIFMLNDWFSPLLTCIHGPGISIYRDFNTPIQILVVGFLSISSLCFVIGFVSALRRINRELSYLLIIIGLFFFFELSLAFMGNLVFVTKYTIICLPVIFLVCADGLLSIKNKHIKILLIYLILLIYVYNAINYKNMPSFSLRNNGYKTIANSLNSFELNKNDYIIYPNGSDLLKKYVKNANFIYLDIPSVLYLDKSKKEALKVFNATFVERTNKHNTQKEFIPFLLNPEPTKELSQFINSSVKKIPSGGRLFFVKDGAPMLKPDEIIYLVKTLPTNKSITDDYNGLVFNLAFNKIYNDLSIIFEESPSLKRIKTVYVGKLNFKTNKNSRWKIIVYRSRIYCP